MWGFGHSVFVYVCVCSSLDEMGADALLCLATSASRDSSSSSITAP